jgi:hypothetical protein
MADENRNLLQMPLLFKRRFLIFAVIIILFSLIMVIFFDQTEDKPLHPFRHGIPGDTTPKGPYKPVNPVISDTAAVADTTITDTTMLP